MSGLPSEWGTPPSLDPPDSVVSRTHDYLDLLGSKILGHKVRRGGGGGDRRQALQRGSKILGHKVRMAGGGRAQT
jgi:hypothetical protein